MASINARRTRKKRKPEEYASHVIRVATWDFYFSRHATDPESKWDTGQFSELATLTFAGEVVRPDKSKYKRGKLTFSARADRPDGQERGSKPVPIGSATARGEEIEAYVFIPEDRLRLLLTAAQSGRVEVAHFAGLKLRYGTGAVLSVSLSTHFDEDEW
jgi:hypothetical protein